MQSCGKTFVEHEFQVRREFEVDALRHQQPQRLALGLQRRDRLFAVLAAEPDDEHARDLQIGRHFYFRDGRRPAREFGIADLPARQHVRERVAHGFAHALEAMGGRGMKGSSGHGTLKRSRFAA